MLGNPLLDPGAPEVILLDAAWACVLLAALGLTSYALGRNIIGISEEWEKRNSPGGWQLLPPWQLAGRVAGALLVVAVDLALLAWLVALF